MTAKKLAAKGDWISILLGRGLKCQFRERQEIVWVIAARLAAMVVTSMLSFARILTLWLESAISGHFRAIGDSRNALDSIFLHYLYSASCLGRWSNSWDWPLFSFHSEPRDRYHSRTFCRNIEID